MTQATDYFSSATLITLCCLISFVGAILIEAFILPHVLLISKKKRLYDIPNGRKSHKNPTPRLGGITFFPTIMLSFLPMIGFQTLFSDNPSDIYSTVFILRLSVVMCGCLTLVLLGIKDDLIGVRYSNKFMVQTIAAMLLTTSGTYINNLYGFLGIYELSEYIAYPFTILLVVYAINSINLIDGVDGLAAALVLIATLVLGFCLVSEGNLVYATLAFAISGILIPFLYYNNLSRRKIFMGDTGSLTLGYLISFLAIHYSMQSELSPTDVPSTLPLLISWSVLFLPLFDTVRVMCVRAHCRKPLFSPDRSHIHHKLIDLGYSHKRVTWLLALFTLCLLGINLILQQTHANINLIIGLDVAIGVAFNLYLNKRARRRVSEHPRTVKLNEYTLSVNYKFNNIPAQQTVINTLNPHSWVTAQHDDQFSQALLASNGLIPDGIGITLAVKWLTGQPIRKMAGADLHRAILEQLNRTSGSVFYLGASTNTLEHIALRIQTEYPRIRVGSFSPIYCDNFPADETEKMIKAVNAFAPDVLFVGMTAPKQEKWVAANRQQLNVRFISCIGAVFGFYAGTVSRPPQWMIRLGLEWLGRLIREPRRMWRRNFISTPKFIIHILQLKFKTTLPKASLKYGIS